MTKQPMKMNGLRRPHTLRKRSVIEPAIGSITASRPTAATMTKEIHHIGRNTLSL